VYDLDGRSVVVIGGGNTAMDAVRTARRLGAAHSAILYRRTEVEMPARIEEVRHAREEGVDFRFLVNPIEFLGDDDGWLSGVRVQTMELGEPDADGRRRPVPIPGTEEELAVQVAIVAAGNAPSPMLRHTPGLRHTPRGTIEADPATGRTSKPGVFAGGDIVTGGATVILAMGAGRRAAASIEEFLAAGEWTTRPTTGT
jgi:glutamate synthase (NADPH/NADH) small chain